MEPVSITYNNSHSCVLCQFTIQLKALNGPYLDFVLKDEDDDDDYDSYDDNTLSASSSTTSTTTSTTTLPPRPTTGLPTPDPYFTHFDPRQEHRAYKEAQQRLEEMHREKVTKVRSGV